MNNDYLYSKIEKYHKLTKLAFISAPDNLVERLFYWVGGAYLAYLKGVMIFYKNINDSFISYSSQPSDYSNNKKVIDLFIQYDNLEANNNKFNEIISNIDSISSSFKKMIWNAGYQKINQDPIQVTEQDLDGWQWKDKFIEIIKIKQARLQEMQNAINNLKLPVSKSKFKQDIVDKGIGFYLLVNVIPDLKIRGSFSQDGKELSINILDLKSPLKNDTLKHILTLLRKIDENYININLMKIRKTLSHELSHLMQTFAEKEIMANTGTTKDSIVFGLGPKIKSEYSLRGYSPNIREISGLSQAEQNKQNAMRQQHNLRAIEFYPRLLNSVENFKEKIKLISPSNHAGFIRDFIGVNGIVPNTDFNFKQIIELINKSKEKLSTLPASTIAALDPKILQFEERVYQNMVKAFLQEISKLGFSI